MAHKHRRSSSRRSRAALAALALSAALLGVTAAQAKYSDVIDDRPYDYNTGTPSGPDYTDVPAFRHKDYDFSTKLRWNWWNASYIYPDTVYGNVIHHGINDNGSGGAINYTKAGQRLRFWDEWARNEWGGFPSYMNYVIRHNTARGKNVYGGAIAAAHSGGGNKLYFGYINADDPLGPLHGSLHIRNNTLFPIDGSGRGGAIAVRGTNANHGKLEIYLQGFGNADGGEDSIFNVYSNDIEPAYKADGTPYMNYGGGLYLEKTDTIVSADHISFRDNILIGYGGGLAIVARDTGKPESQMATAKFYASYDVEFLSHDIGGNGGAMYIENGPLTITAGTNVTVSGNTARNVFANAGYGAGARVKAGTLDVTAGGNITFAHNTAGWAGGAAYVSDGSKLLLKAGGNIAFDGNVVSADGANGGAIAVHYLAALSNDLNEVMLSSAKNISFTGNAAPNDGGAVFAELGDFTATAEGDLTFANNTAQNNGGALAAMRSNGGATLLKAENVTFAGNKGKHGGAVYLSADTKTQIKAAKKLAFENNATLDTASLAQGGAVLTAGDLTLTAGEELSFAGNTAFAHQSVRGGALAVLEGAALDIGGGSAPKSIVFSSNAVSTDDSTGDKFALGGAVYVKTNTLALTAAEKAEFRGNNAHAVHNVAEGGAVYAEDSDITVSAPELTFAENRASTGARGVGESGKYARGGALFANGGHIRLETDTLTVDGNSASGALRGTGGAFMTYNGELTVDAGTAVFRGNSVLAPGAQGVARGGAVFVEGGSAEWNVGTELTFQGNDAEAAHIASGAAVWTDGDVTFAGADNTGEIRVESNTSLSTATTTTGDGDSGAYGAVTITGGHLTASGVNHIIFSHNSATGPIARGGAVALRAGTATFSARALELAENAIEATYDNARGGAVYSAGGLSVAVGNAMISGNIAKATASSTTVRARGGAIYSGGTTIWKTADDGFTLFVGNEAHGAQIGAGGAFYTSGDATFSGGVLFFENNLSIASAGIAYGALNVNSGVLSVDVEVLAFLDNDAAGSAAYGGALALNGASATITADGLNFDGNKAEATGGDAWGGAVLLSGDAAKLTVNVKDAMFIANRASTGSGVARGGAVFSGGGSVWNVGESLTFEDNESTGVKAAAGSALCATGSITINGGQIVFAGNKATASEGPAYGALGANQGSLTIANAGQTNWGVQFDGNRSTGLTASGAGVTLMNGSASIESRTVIFADNIATGTNGDASGGGLFSNGAVNVTAEDRLRFNGNKAVSTGGISRGGAVFAKSGITITIGDGTLPGKATFSGNEAALGGALYSETGDIVLTNAGNRSAEYDFATATDDVFAAGGNIAIGCRLVAQPGTSFTARDAFTLGETPGDSVLTVMGAKYVTTADERDPGDLTLFGGQSINFNRAQLNLINIDEIEQDVNDEFRYMADVATVMYKTDPGYIDAANGVSADVTGQDWALDVSTYRNSRLYIHRAVKQSGEQIDAVKANLDGFGSAYVAKLVLAFNRYSLIWRGEIGETWDSANDGHAPWIMSKSNDIFTPDTYPNGGFIPESFYRGDIVVFDGNIYDVEMGTAVSADSTIEVPVEKHGGVLAVSPSDMYITGGSYKFVAAADLTGGIAADKLYVRSGSDGTGSGIVKADFSETPVKAWEALSVDVNTQVSFDMIETLEHSPAEIAGTVNAASPLRGQWTVRDGGSLTLQNGSGTMTSLTLESGSTLTVGTLGAYMISEQFTAKDGSHTVVKPTGNEGWAPGSSTHPILMGFGEAAAKVGDKAKLTIYGIEPGATGTWTLLGNFQKGVEATDNVGWGNIEAGTLSVTGYSGLVASADAQVGDYAYEVKKTDDGKSYVLVIAQKSDTSTDVTPPGADEIDDSGSGDKPKTDDGVVDPTEKDTDDTGKDDTKKDTGENKGGNTGGNTGDDTDDDDPVVTPSRGGHTEVYHIAGSVQRALTRAAELGGAGALGGMTVDGTGAFDGAGAGGTGAGGAGALTFEPRHEKLLWVNTWRNQGRNYDENDVLGLKHRAWGVVIGRDLSKSADKTFGVALHIGKGDASGKGQWDGGTSETDFWGALVYGRRDLGKWLLVGDASMSWFKTDYDEPSGASADNARSTMFSLGGRAYYKWVNDPRPGKFNVMPFVGLRWNHYRQSAYGYDTGLQSMAWTTDQVYAPLGVKIQWGAMTGKSGWTVTPSLEASYIRTFGSRKAVTGISAKDGPVGAFHTPLADRDTFAAEFRYTAKRKNFTWDIGAGMRRSSSQKEYSVGTTLKWDL